MIPESSSDHKSLAFPPVIAFAFSMHFTASETMLSTIVLAGRTSLITAATLPIRTAAYCPTIDFSGCFSISWYCIDAGLWRGLLVNGGATYVWNDPLFGQGFDLISSVCFPGCSNETLSCKHSTAFLSKSTCVQCPRVPGISML
ncbi:hypothetical protein AG1IA_03085 [Rhizoctonia solani AG-1 IA]|uniref:Uncharacterized protein n=1 Tax=Thanatephorus cucumeris (strain AG1-IA) TaxID=983506 RepID=L8X1I1_THACA|nr:hypothetical protein AG1IA_03085 [Rhizoctonia solani AG-1 IA]